MNSAVALNVSKTDQNAIKSLGGSDQKGYQSIYYKMTKGLLIPLQDLIGGKCRNHVAVSNPKGFYCNPFLDFGGGESVEK